MQIKGTYSHPAGANGTAIALFAGHSNGRLYELAVTRSPNSPPGGQTQPTGGTFEANSSTAKGGACETGSYTVWAVLQVNYPTGGPQFVTTPNKPGSVTIGAAKPAPVANISATVTSTLPQACSGTGSHFYGRDDTFGSARVHLHFASSVGLPRSTAVTHTHPPATNPAPVQTNPFTFDFGNVLPDNYKIMAVLTLPGDDGPQSGYSVYTGWTPITVP